MKLGRRVATHTYAEEWKGLSSPSLQFTTSTKYGYVWWNGASRSTIEFIKNPVHSRTLE